MLRKLVILQAVALLGLGSIFMLPRTYGMRESALLPNLPDGVEGWVGHAEEVPEKVERELADDTRFDQKFYVRETPGRIGKVDVAKAFVVLSGNDMNNSIHRPERCFRAQGLTILGSSVVEIEVGYNKTLKARRLLSRSAAGHQNITYYWFTGAAKLTTSHYDRTITDMIDRLRTGTNQSWAYITVAADFGYEESSEHRRAAKTEAATDEMLTDLIAKLFEPTHKVDQLAGWSKTGP